MESFETKMENTGNNLETIKKRIKDIKEAKNHIDGMVGLGDLVPADAKIIEEKEDFIGDESEAVLSEIEKQFESLYAEIMNGGEIKSETKTYAPEGIIATIKAMKEIANKGNDSFDPRNITRTNGLRKKVTDLLDLLVSFRQI